MASVMAFGQWPVQRRTDRTLVNIALLPLKEQFATAYRIRHQRWEPARIISNLP